MTPTIAVLQLSDSFADQWARLAATAGAEVLCVRSAADLAGVPGACGVLVAAGGVEADAFGVLRANEARPVRGRGRRYALPGRDRRPLIATG